MIPFTVASVVRALVWMGSLALVASAPRYLYHNDETSMIQEYTTTSGLFLASTHPRVVEFYSPSCVSARRTTRLSLRPPNGI
jgi:hypothetical protein